jgi:protein-S-isoprenylcysteine O-methyltransferase Ste14
MTRSRGTGWVVAQFVLLAAVLAAALVPPGWPDGARTALAVTGALVAAGGAALAVWSARALGPSLTPFPRPARSAPLVEAGPYRVVRHPIYAGGIVFCVGWSLFAGPMALVLTGCLAVLWALKARVEESHLDERHAPGYADYARRVRWRLLPGVF